MGKNEILERVQSLFQDVLDDDSINLSAEMSSEDIEGYDSLAHIQIVDAISKEFKTKFKAREIMSWSSIGEMIDCIHNKLNQ